MVSLSLDCSPVCLLSMSNMLLPLLLLPGLLLAQQTQQSGPAIVGRSGAFYSAEFWSPVPCTAPCPPSPGRCLATPCRPGQLAGPIEQGRPSVSYVGHNYSSKLEVILIEQAEWKLSHLKDTRKQPLLDTLTNFGQRESAPAILGLY